MKYIYIYVCTYSGAVQKVVRNQSLLRGLVAMRFAAPGAPQGAPPATGAAAGAMGRVCPPDECVAVPPAPPNIGGPSKVPKNIGAQPGGAHLSVQVVRV